jgi:hypothetical protein
VILVAGEVADVVRLRDNELDAALRLEQQMATRPAST